MAEKLERYRFARRYPWYQWTDGEPYELERGRDYDVTMKSFRGAAWLHARSHDLDLRTSVTVEPDTEMQVTAVDSDDGVVRQILVGEDIYDVDEKDPGWFPGIRLEDGTKTGRRVTRDDDGNLVVTRELVVLQFTEQEDEATA